MTTIKSILLLLAVIALSGLEAQKIFLDQPLTVGDGVIVFPSVDDPQVFYYMPDRPRVALNDAGQPEFSFTLYSEKDRSALDADNKEEQAGGGILHLLMTFGVSADRLSGARTALSGMVEGAVIKGPVIFTKGNIALISAVANPKGGFTKEILGLGKAPILEGSKAAIAFMLDARGAKLLWATFNNSTPDVSFSMEMEVDGYLSPMNGSVEGDFDQIYESHNASLGVSGSIGVVTLGAEIGMTLEKLEKEGKIKVHAEGTNAYRDTLLKIAYTKLVNMMFVSAESSYTAAKTQEKADRTAEKDPLERMKDVLSELKKDKKEGKEGNTEGKSSETLTDDGEEGVGETATKTKKNQEERLHDDGGQGPFGADYFSVPVNLAPSPSSAPATAPKKAMADAPKTVAPFSILATYRYRKVKQTGRFSIDLNTVSSATRAIRMDGNIGDMRRRCERCFKVVWLDEMYMFKQREVTVLLDGSLLSEFKNFVNSVDVTLRKRHPDGYVETETVGIDYARFNTSGRVAKLVYGRQENENDGWLDYEYRVTWNFHGNYTVQGEWTKDASDYISLSAPLGIKRVNIDADPKLMKANGIRSIQVMLEYDLGGTTQLKKVRLKNGGTMSEDVAVVLPLDSEEVYYRYLVVTEAGEKFVQRERKPVDLLSLTEITTIPK